MNPLKKGAADVAPPRRVGACAGRDEDYSIFNKPYLCSWSG